VYYWLKRLDKDGLISLIDTGSRRKRIQSIYVKRYYGSIPQDWFKNPKSRRTEIKERELHAYPTFDKVPSYLNPLEVGSEKEIAARYLVKLKYRGGRRRKSPDEEDVEDEEEGIGVIDCLVVNATSRMMAAADGLEEEYDDPLDETVLDHFIRGLVLEYAQRKNWDSSKGKYWIQPRCLSEGNVSSKEALMILRSLPLLKRKRHVLLFHIDFLKLERFVRTKNGATRFSSALKNASAEYKEAIKTPLDIGTNLSDSTPQFKHTDDSRGNCLGN
jgi:hypothetical protein